MKLWTIDTVDGYVRAHIFEMLQLPSNWVSVKPERKIQLRKKFLDEYLTFAKLSLSTWKKMEAKNFNNTIQNWFMNRYENPTASRFTKVDCLIYGPDIFPNGFPVWKTGPSRNHKCRDRCGENCSNRRSLMECDSHCASGDRCKNRESQCGFNFEDFMQVRYISKEKGSGLFATKFIPDETFIGQMTGEALPESEHNIRKSDPVRAQYMLQFKMNAGDPVFSVDPTEFGNHTRFCNHSCEPNAGFIVWTVGRTEILKLETIKDIHPVSIVLTETIAEV